MEEDKVVLTLTVTDANFILGILAEKPYKEVANIIHLISIQANEQLATKQPEE
jgi:hypothetical protein